MLYVATAEQRDLLQQTYDEFRRHSDNVRLIEPQAAAARACLREQLCGALEEPDARDIDVHGLQGFLRGMRARGATLRANAELRAASHADGVWTLALADGATLRARAIINAAGAWADHVAALCAAAPVGLQPCRRTAFTFNGPPDVDFSAWPAVVGVDESYYFKPDAGQLLGSPANADPVEAHDVAPEELDVATGIYRIEEATSLTIRRPKHTWAGLRSFVRDGDFVVGWDEAAPASSGWRRRAATASRPPPRPRNWRPRWSSASQCPAALRMASTPAMRPPPALILFHSTRFPEVPMTAITRYPSTLPLPFSRATRAGGFLFLSGQIPMDADGKVVRGDIREQTHAAIARIKDTLALANASLADVVRVTVWLADLAQFADFNEAYREHFPADFPTRSTVEARLALEVDVEIEVQAWVGDRT